MYNHSLVGVYHHKCLPLGVANYPDIFQQKMNDLFHGLKFLCVHIQSFDILKGILDISCTEIRINDK